MFLCLRRGFMGLEMIAAAECSAQGGGALCANEYLFALLKLS